ncbi:MAG: YtxH domain-containing protein [Thermodesulfovibrionales bacterium]
MRDDTVRIAGAFLLGGLVGAAVALLYAPKSGIETRRDISKAARRIKRDIGDLVEDTVERVNEFASDVKERATAIIEEGIELSEDARKEIVATLEHGQKAIEKQKKRLIDALGL